jgi:hypothetical protein
VASSEDNICICLGAHFGRLTLPVSAGDIVIAPLGEKLQWKQWLLVYTASVTLKWKRLTGCSGSDRRGAVPPLTDSVEPQIKENNI